MRYENLSARLRSFRRSLDWSQSELANALGLLRSTYASYELGRAKLPEEVLIKLKSLGFDEKSEVNGPLLPVSSPTVPLPKGPDTPCSNWSDPMLPDYEDTQEVDAFMAGPGRFACRVVGDSMYPLIWPEDICVWQSSTTPKIGTVVLAVNFRNEATIAQLKHNGTNYVLHKLNPNYAPVEAPEWKIVGYLVGQIREEGSRRTTIYDPKGIRPL